MIKIPVFYYHSIGNIGPQTLSIEHFRAHLTLLKQQGFTTLNASELVNLDSEDTTRYAVLSFDDGLLDNYEHAAPLLQEFGFTATFFVIPGFDQITRWVNPDTGAWSDVVADGFSIPFPSMQAPQRLELANAGMEIGCHSMTHPKLNKIPVSQLNTEISASKTLLEEQLGRSVTSFCYPKGRYNQHVLDAVEAANYSCAFTTMPAYYSNKTSPLQCGRFLVEDPTLFAKVLNWSASSQRWTEPLCRLMWPLLKLKNYYS